ncbi:MAG: hypothetical protein KF788_08690 [Piscinibacter sp.]|nr:hypothetical protein [Piscinibacter sp.]
MNAALQTSAPPVQATLAGVEPAAEEGAALELRWSVCGQLQRAAEVRVSPCGQHGHLVLRLQQPAHGKRRRPPLVLHHHAHGAAVQRLHELAARLQPGALVLCLGRGLDIEHEGAPPVRDAYLHAWRCDRIAPIPPAEARQWLPDAAIDPPPTAQEGTAP